jgi:membrane protein
MPQLDTRPDVAGGSRPNGCDVLPQGFAPHLARGFVEQLERHGTAKVELLVEQLKGKARSDPLGAREPGTSAAHGRNMRWALPGQWASRALRWLRPLAKGLGRARTFGLAAEMSFWVFLSLVPLAAMAGMAAAKLALSHAWLGGAALGSVPPEMRDLIHRQVEYVAAWHGATVAPLATATFLWLASSGIQAVFDALEVQTGCARPWWKKRVLALGTCVALSLGVVLLALLGTGLAWVEGLAGRHLPEWVLRAVHGPVGSALREAAGAAVAVAMTAGLYRVAIGRRGEEHGRPLPVLPGAVFAVGLGALLGWGYGWYLGHLGRGGAYEAGLAVVAVTLTRSGSSRWPCSRGRS